MTADVMARPHTSEEPLPLRPAGHDPAPRGAARPVEPRTASPEALLGSADRLLVVAPHPDDETLATGGMIQRAAALGAPVRVVFVTDGDKNPWAQRAFEHRISVGAADQARFGARRRREALEALARLGQNASCARFLGEPDQGLTGLLLRAPAAAAATLRSEIALWRPTLIAGPSPADLHPDHSATAALLALALDHPEQAGTVPRRLCYTIHNPDLRSQADATVALTLSPEELKRKRDAIACHRTQAILRGPWLRSFASQEERFHPADATKPFAAHPVSVTALSAGGVELRVTGRARPRAFGAPTLHIIVAGPDDTYRSLSVAPARPGAPPIALDLLTGEAVPLDIVRSAGTARVALPAGLVAPGSLVLVKLARRWGFFDEAGWRLFRVTS